MLQMKEYDKNLKKDFNAMEISDFPETEFKIMVIKMPIEVRRAVHKVRISTKRQKNKQVPDINHKAEECNNCTEKYTTPILKEDQMNGGKDQQMRRQGSGIHPLEEEKKSEASSKDFWDTIKPINIYIIRVPGGEERKGQKTFLT